MLRRVLGIIENNFIMRSIRGRGRPKKLSREEKTRTLPNEIIPHSGGSKDTPQTQPSPHDNIQIQNEQEGINNTEISEEGRERIVKIEVKEEPSENVGHEESESSVEFHDLLHAPHNVKRPAKEWEGKLRLYSPSPINNSAKYTDLNFPLVSMLDKDGEGYDGKMEITGIMQCCFNLYKEVYEGFVINLLSEDPHLCMKIIPENNLPMDPKETDILKRRVTRGQKETKMQGNVTPFTPTVHWNRLKEHFDSYNVMSMICECFNEAAKVSVKHTYGETSFNMVQKIIEFTRPTRSDSFLDLGSGIGNVVLHMTAAKKLRSCVGVEISAVPNQYAKQMKKEFYRWLPFFGKWTRNCKLLEGNFLDEEFDQYFKKATIILVNNYKFDDNLNNLLAEKFFEHNLKHGVRIISTKPFCKNKERIYQHNARVSQRLESVMDVEELPLIADCVSWTSRAMPYYLHRINLRKAFLLPTPRLLPPPPPHASDHTKANHVRRTSLSSSTQDSPQTRDIEKELAEVVSVGGGGKRGRKRKIATKSPQHDTADDSGLPFKKRKILQEKDNNILIAQTKSDRRKKSANKNTNTTQTFPTPMTMTQVEMFAFDNPTTLGLNPAITISIPLVLSEDVLVSL